MGFRGYALVFFTEATRPEEHEDPKTLTVLEPSGSQVARLLAGPEGLKGSRGIGSMHLESRLSTCERGWGPRSGR